MRIFLMISAAALIVGGSLPARACTPNAGVQASAAQVSTIELAAATVKKKTAKKPAKKKKEKIEYMRATG